MTDGRSLRARYDDWAPTYDLDTDRVTWAAPRRLLEVVLAHRPARSWLRVLDLGIGTGQASVPFVRAGARVIGLDVAPAMLAEAGARYPELHALLEHDLDRGFPTGLREHDADIVLACGVLHHVRALQPALALIARALAPGGLVAFTYLPPASRTHEPHARVDVPERVDAAVGALGWQRCHHESFVAYHADGRSDAAVTYGLVVARDPRPAQALPAALHFIDRTACVDRRRVLEAYDRVPWRGPMRMTSAGAMTCAGASRELLTALRAGLEDGALDLRTLPWPNATPESRPAASGCDLLAILPHPDDESVHAGGTIAGVVDAGLEVHLSIATDGGGGRGGPDLCRRRMRELLRAVATLGIRSVECLGWPDFGKYHDASRSQPYDLVDTLRVWGLEPRLVDVVRSIRAHRPVTVLSLDPEVDPNYSLHGHHLALGLLVAVAFHLAADAEFAPDVGPPWAPLEHRVMSPLAEATFGEVVELDRGRKRTALLAHASQAYSTASVLRALGDPMQPALEVTRRVQARARVPLWIARARGPSVDLGIDWRFEAGRVLSHRRPRGELVDLLRSQAATRPCDPTVDSALERLADSGTVAVVTGQQVGLLGGPALTLHKALAAVALAQRIERAGVPAVPVFWMATYDHDLDEVRSVPRLGGPPLRFPIASDGRAVGARRLGDDIRVFVESWIDAVGARREGLPTLLHECFSPDATFASAFARFLATITRGMGLVILDPGDPRLCALARPCLERELLGPDRMAAPLGKARARLLAQGRSETVETTRDVLQLFIHDADDRRRRLRATDAGVAWTGGELETSAARALLARAPARISPAALMRPLVQDAVLPTVAYVAGPTEARYFEQLTEAYAWADLPMPRIIRRPSILAMTHRDAATLAAVGSRDVLVESERPEAAIGRAGLPPRALEWLGQIEALIESIATARADARHGTPIDPARLRSAWQDLDTAAPAALVELERVLRTWSSSFGCASSLLNPRARTHPGVASSTRPLTRMLRALARIRRSLLREGRRKHVAVMAAWRRVSPSPAAPERRASVAEVLAQLGPESPHAILRALRRNFVADVAVQGEEPS